MSCLIFSHLLQTYLRLTTILLVLPKFRRIVLWLPDFERSNFMSSSFKKQKIIIIALHIERVAIGAFQIFDLPGHIELEHLKPGRPP